MKVLLKSVLVLIIISFLPLSAWAQTDGPSWARINLVTVKPEYVEEFVELQKQITARTKERGVPFRAAWTVANFGTNYRYAFFTPMSSFAELDSPPQGGNSTIGSKFRKYTTARESRAFIYEASLSKPMPQGETPTLAIVTVRTIAPGRTSEYREFLENDVVPYLSAAETGLEGFIITRTIFGGAETWTTFAFIEDYAYIDGGSMAARTLDEAARAALAKKQVGLVTHLDRFVIRYIPELSYSAAASSASNGNE